MEVWKKTHISERHEVSNYGRVRTVDAYIKNPIHGVCLRKGRIRKPSQNGYGYERVTLSVNGKRHYESVHRLVAIAFIENPEGKPFVNHIDGNKLNNRADNLEWCTPKENARHAVETGLFDPSSYQQGEASASAKLKSADVLRIRHRYSLGETITEIKKDYDVSFGTISCIVKNKTWKNLL